MQSITNGRDSEFLSGACSLFVLKLLVAVVFDDSYHKKKKGAVINFVKETSCNERKENFV